MKPHRGSNMTMTKRLESAIKTICEGAMQMPMQFEMPGGGVAIFMPLGASIEGHGKFPLDLDFELVILDAMGEVVYTQTRTYR